MRSTLCLSVLLVASVFSAAQSSAGDQKQVEELERQLNSDPKGVVSPELAQKYIADDYVWMMPDGEKGRSDLTKPLSGQTVYDGGIKDLKVRMLGDTAVAYGRWWKRAKVADDGKVHEWSGFFQDVWSKQGGSWKLVAGASGPIEGTDKVVSQSSGK